MNALIQELALEAGLEDSDFPLENWDNVPLEKFAKLVARRCIQVALDWDDPIMAVEMADLFDIT
jgi:hypothetical protein